ncbi:MAG: hypothetical protein GTN74_16085 [Proteobacteria bacterium]|nr:hypothetical protein [Pseudomonadota bacterium]NIS72164.1 hypothetical protein [Pseudomonadota bacterium]
MISSIFASISGIVSSFRRHDVTAQNVTKADTYGYKVCRIVAQENRTGGADSTHLQRINSQGPLIHTGRPLDLALHGEGFFNSNRMMEQSPIAGLVSSP